MILENTPIPVFNNSNLRRDFTYISDIVMGVTSALKNLNGYQLFNLGNNKTVELGYFIEVLEKLLNKKAIKNFLPMQPGDVYETFADIDKTKTSLGFQPNVSIEEGLAKFIEWYNQYHGGNK